MCLYILSIDELQRAWRMAASLAVWILKDANRLLLPEIFIEIRSLAVSPIRTCLLRGQVGTCTAQAPAQSLDAPARSTQTLCLQDIHRASHI